MRATLAAAALLACAGSAAAAGPSFDCARAASADEHLICADPALAQADADLAGVYHTVMDGLAAGQRSALEIGERSWLRFARLSCSASSKIRSSKDRAVCLADNYRHRARQLFDSEQQIGLFHVLRVHAYALIELDPATSERSEQAGPTIERETYDYVEPSFSPPRTLKGVEAWNAWVIPKNLLSAATVYNADPKRDADGPEGAFRSVKILDATEQVIVFERVAFDKTTVRGSDTESYGVWMLPEARLARLTDLFHAGTPWSAYIAKRVNADIDRDFLKSRMYEGDEPSSFKTSAEGLGIDSGHIDGFAPPQHMTTIAWADLKPYLSERGQTLVDSFPR